MCFIGGGKCVLLSISEFIDSIFSSKEEKDESQKMPIHQPCPQVFAVVINNPKNQKATNKWISMV